MAVVTSQQYSLNLADLGKGLLLAVISAVLTTVETSLSAGEVTFNWKAIGIVAATTAVSYLLKNFFSPAVTIVNPPVQAPGTTTTDATVTVTPKP